MDAQKVGMCSDNSSNDHLNIRYDGSYKYDHTRNRSFFDEEARSS